MQPPFGISNYFSENKQNNDSNQNKQKINRMDTIDKSDKVFVNFLKFITEDIYQFDVNEWPEHVFVSYVAVIKEIYNNSSEEDDMKFMRWAQYAMDNGANINPKDDSINKKNVNNSPTFKYHSELIKNWMKDTTKRQQDLLVDKSNQVSDNVKKFSGNTWSRIRNL